MPALLGKEKLKAIGVELEPSDCQRIKTLAKSKGQSISGLAREVLVSFLNKELGEVRSQKNA